MNEQEMKARFDELAPWHANGTLDPTESRWVEDYARTHPDAGAELHWYTAFRRELTANQPDISPELGWDKLAARIATEKRATRKSFGERAREFLGGLLGVSREGGSLALRPALAYAAVAIVVVQAGVIGALVTQQGKQDAELAQWRSMRATGVIGGPVLRLSFKPETTEQDIRTLLVRMDGSLVGGPGQLGAYIVYVPADRITAAQAAAQQDAHVESVDVLATLPVKE
jgi:hypothetical protein